MECNKDEAVRAKEIAEKKMQNNDFEGAHKIALKAKNLYPELDNIIQMLSICDVHCSAQRRLSESEKDWYGVLQVEKLADEATIRKQYRRLALILHPDKNRFPGAEGAFKLICEANALLSDPVKKSAYDNKLRLLTRSALVNPPNHRQFSAQGIPTSNGLSRANEHQVPQSTVSVFWTCCPFCSVRYQYQRQFINRSLQCPTCKRVFVTYEVSARSVSSRSKLGCQGASFVPSKPDVCQSSSFQERVVNNQENSEIMKQNAKVPSASHAGSRSTASSKIAKPRVKKGCGSDSVKVESASHGEKVDATINGHATHRAPRHTKSKSQKRGKNEQDNLGDAATELESKVTGVRIPHEDDCARPLKRAHRTEETNGYEQTAATFNAAADAVDIESDSNLDLSSNESSEARCFNCPDPEFSDFDKLRDENLFRVGQFWTCYDETFDGMPRYYAKIIKVSASPFELQFKWLEAVPISDAYKRWVKEELPVGCGSFKLGKPEKVSGSLSFSHQVHCEMGKKKGSHFIYPRKGEVWAIFRDWHVTWSSNPEDHMDFRYEVVEVLSNYAADIGAEVCYLNKVTGFVSLFHRASETNSFVIGPVELYKFSHCVPSFKMSGTERGVPVGSFELDPAALPLNPHHLYFPSKTENEHKDTSGIC